MKLLSHRQSAPACHAAGIISHAYELRNAIQVDVCVERNSLCMSLL